MENKSLGVKRRTLRTMMEIRNTTEISDGNLFGGVNTYELTI